MNRGDKLTNINYIKTGTVKFYSTMSKYGFLTADDGSGDSFVNFDFIKKAKLKTLEKGQKVTYEIFFDGYINKTYADNIKLINATNNKHPF
jgi:CspA family cold shock protein